MLPLLSVSDLAASPGGRDNGQVITALWQATPRPLERRGLAQIVQIIGRPGPVSMVDRLRMQHLTELAAPQEGQQQFVEPFERLRSELISRTDRADSAIAAIRDDIAVTIRLSGRAQEVAIRQSI
jgi:hypothetical protein